MATASEWTDDTSGGSLFSRLRAVKELAIVQGLDDQQLTFVAAIAELVHLERGTVLFREGEIHQQLYFIQHGSVALEMHVPQKGPQRILTVGPGELLAWSSILGDGRMTATAIVLEDSQFIRFAGNKFAELCSRERDIGWVLMRGVATAVSKRLLATRLQLLDLFRHEQK